MLEARTFLIRRGAATLKAGRRCVLTNSATGEQLGAATESTETLVQLVRLFLSESIVPKRIEVREQPDESLLMVLSRGWSLLRGTCEIRDAVGELVGTLRRLPGRAASYAIHDPYEKQFADCRGDIAKQDYRIRTPEQDYTLARVQPQGGSILLEISEDLEEQPPAKMMILGTVLMLAMLIDARTPNED